MRKFLLSLPDDSNGFSLEMLCFVTAAKSLRHSSFDILRSTSSSSRRPTVPSFRHYQSLACRGYRLHLKNSGNYKDLQNFKLRKSGKITEANFAAKRDPKIF
jgi:hypothetical protein